MMRCVTIRFVWRTQEDGNWCNGDVMIFEAPDVTDECLFFDVYRLPDGRLAVKS
jgi:hypothetical protein